MYPDLSLNLRDGLAYGSALLAAGKRHEFCVHSAAMWQAFEYSAVPSNLVHVAFLCGLTPNSQLDTRAIVKTLRANLKASLAGEAPHTSLQFGTSLYRDGQYAETVELMTKAITFHETASDATRRGDLALAQCFAAMAHLQLGQFDKAETYLNKTRTFTNALPETLSWDLRVHLKALQSEASALILGQGTAAINP